MCILAIRCMKSRCLVEFAQWTSISVAVNGTQASVLIQLIKLEPVKHPQCMHDVVTLSENDYKLVTYLFSDISIPSYLCKVYISSVKYRRPQPSVHINLYEQHNYTNFLTKTSKQYVMIDDSMYIMDATEINYDTFSSDNKEVKFVWTACQYQISPKSRKQFFSKINSTRNAWQSLAYSPLGAVVSPPSKYL